VWRTVFFLFFLFFFIFFLLKKLDFENPPLTHFIRNSSPPPFHRRLPPQSDSDIVSIIAGIDTYLTDVTHATYGSRGTIRDRYHIECPAVTISASGAMVLSSSVYRALDLTAASRVAVHVHRAVRAPGQQHWYLGAPPFPVLDGDHFVNVSEKIELPQCMYAVARVTESLAERMRAGGRIVGDSVFFFFFF
jgi:hypothetical protein